MKRLLGITLTILLVIALLQTGGNVVTKADSGKVVLKLTIGNVIMTVNDKAVALDVAPVIIESRTLLPIRWIAEPLGAKVDWDNSTKKVTVTLENTKIELWIGKSTAQVNGVATPIDANNSKVVPVIINSRTMIPIRFISENLGCQVDWNSTTRTVTITYEKIVIVEKIKVGLCTDVGGRGDKSFNDSALRGLENWAAGVKMVAGTGYKALTTDEFNKIIADEAPDLADRGIKSFAVEPVVLESKANEDYVPNLKKLADDGCKLVIGVGFMLTDAITEVAPQYPNTYFMLIDGVIDPAPANVVCYVFKEQEGSCLVGALAGQMTKANKVGFVGGMELSLIKRFEAGYKAGVKIVNPNAEVFSGYTGNFTNADDGQKIAKAQFDKGADIVYHASGACGIGVIKEAQARGTGYYAIGVDSDQDYLAPGRVLTSMIKHVDYACWLATKSVIDKTFTSGIVTLGIKEGGVGMSPLKYTKDIIPAAAIAKVEKIRQMIASGTLVVPDTLEAFATFVPPAIP